MPNTPDQPKLPQGISKADARKAKKIATGPLMGPISGHLTPEAKGADQASPASLGTFQSVKARIKKAQESTDSTPGNENPA
jgi:hypothetical protein